MNDELEVKHLEATIEKKEDGSFTAVASTNATDRHGEVVDNNGWDLKAYKKNPVILWGHDHNEPAIGTAKKVWVDGQGKRAKLMIQPILHDVTEKARAIKELVDRGIIKTLSVGFKPLESPDGVTFTKNELLEVSMVNVPANAEAMTLAYKSLKTAGFKKEVIEDLGIKQMDEAQMQASIKDIQQAIKAVQADIEKITEIVEKQVIDNEEKETENDTQQVKAPQAVNPTNIIRERLSMNKVIAKAADKILEAEKKNAPVDKVKLVKVIKRANEILTVAEKDKL